jgi:4-hydroxybenzoate polyprenyltransferase
MTSAVTWLRLLRIKQWTKNAVVFAAFVFALGDRNQDLSAWELWKVCLAALAFSLVSSAVYILNDLRDAPQDRLHPVKKNRPIAAGAVARAPALGAAAVLLAAGLGGAGRLGTDLLAVIGGYLVLQGFYTLWLKRIALVDVIVIALGFVLRALAGAVVIHVVISPWLLVCALVLALFLGLCKRRHEKVNLAGQGTRAALDGYDGRLLDQLIAVTAAAAWCVLLDLYPLARNRGQVRHTVAGGHHSVRGVRAVPLHGYRLSPGEGRPAGADPADRRAADGRRGALRAGRAGILLLR